MKNVVQFFLCYLSLMTAVVVVISSPECLKCWNQLCGPGGVPSCAEPPMNECIDYDNRGINVGKLSNNRTCCCEESRGYVDTVVQSLDQQMQESESCTSEYNSQMEERFNTSLFNNGLSPNFQHVFPDIQFSCKGCISNITFYTNTGQMVRPTIFSILLWSPYRSSTDNSSVYMLRSNNNYSINVTETLMFDSWANGAGRRSTLSLEEYSICFEPGNVFGMSVPGRGDFNLEIFREMDNAMTTTVYQRNRPFCKSLGSVWYPESSQRIGNVLIAVGVREAVVTIVTTAVTTTTTAATVFPTSSPISSPEQSSIMITNIHTTPTRPVVPISSPPSPIPSSTTTNTSPPTADMPQPVLAYAAAGAAGGVLVVTFIMALVVISVCVVQRQKRKYKQPDDVEPYAVGTSTSFHMINQDSSPTQHGYNVPNNFEDSANINDYDEPLELDRTDFQRNHTALTTITERGTLNEGQYTDMSGHQMNGPPQVRRYQVPRSAPPNYDTPRRSEENNWSSDYDAPTALDSHQHGSTNKQHHYFELEDSRRAKDNKREHTYQVLEQENAKVQEPIYFVLEPGLLVPTADEREQWATGSGGSQDSVRSNSQGTMLFEDKPHYWEPADQLERIYDQLSQNKCREIPREDLTFTGVIGSGEFGTVSRATWKMRRGGGMDVAVKQLKIDASEEDRTKFFREGARMMQFFHTNVVKLHGMVTVGPTAMLVVELMPNGDLKNHLKRLRNERNPPPPSQLLRFGKDVALGMRHLAKKGFVHRDLAARNILLNDSLICKIGDFGMTRAMSHTYDKNKVEQIPLRWTAPEAFSERKYTEKSDVYSYGMVLFEIWSIGRKPFPGKDNDMFIQFIKQGGVQNPPPGCPRGIYELMINCWNPNYRERNTFADICDYLSVPDDSLLHWSSQDKRISKKAMQLGADLGHGADLYPDLQRQYRKDDD